MKVKFLKGAAGPDWCYRAGEVVELDDEEALSLIKVGAAEKVKNKSIQKAVAASGSRTMTERFKFK